MLDEKLQRLADYAERLSDVFEDVHVRVKGDNSVEVVARRHTKMITSTPTRAMRYSPLFVRADHNGRTL